MNHKYLNTNQTIIPTLRYFPHPPMMYTTTYYDNTVNKDPNLRKLMTTFFLNKTIKWLKSCDQFKHLKNILPKITSDSGYHIIYNLLKIYVKNNEVNWYDLKDYYLNIKDYLKYKLGKL